MRRFAVHLTVKGSAWLCRDRKYFPYFQWKILVNGLDSEVFEMKPTRTLQEAEITQKSPSGDDFLSDNSGNFINLYCAVQHEAVKSISNRKLL